MARSPGLDSGEFERLVAELLGLVGTTIEVTISGIDLLPPLIAELHGELRGGSELGVGDRLALNVGADGSLVLDRAEIGRWWRENDVLVVESGAVRVAMAARRSL
jgi:hypothetical protein